MIDTQTMVDFPVFADSGQHIKPADAKYSGGFLPADTLPAQYANWLWYKTSKAVTELNKGVESIEEELNSILTAAGITPSEATNDQVKTAVLQWIADAKNLTNATNTLAVSHGGTGSTSAQGAFNALANGMNESKAAPDETDYLITTSTEQDKTNWRRKNFSYLWVWIKSKIAGITDSTPTASSNNLITSGGTKTALDTKPDKPNFVTLAQYNAKTSAERAGKYWIITDATGVDVPLIQDDTKSTTTVWSSTKTDNQINGALLNYVSGQEESGIGVNSNKTITLKQNSCIVFLRGYNTDGKGFVQLYLCSQITSLSNIQSYLIHYSGATSLSTNLISSTEANKITITTTNMAINRIKIIYL